jgi:hypothetical protein
VRLDVSWGRLQERVRELGESGDTGDPTGRHDDELLDLLGFTRLGELTALGHDYFMARFVLNDGATADRIIGDLLKELPEVSAFCEALWGRGPVPISGAVSLLKRLTHGSEMECKRMLELMNRGDLVRYNRRNPVLSVDWNPRELLIPDEEAERERQVGGHVLTPEAKYGNVLALRELLEATRSFIYWYEQHVDRKILDTLYKMVPKDQVAEIRILSGPGNVSPDLKEDFKRFRDEVAKNRGIHSEWRVLSKLDARDIHGRFLFSEGMARNLPPLNLIYKGTNDEILPSELDTDAFEKWWKRGTDLLSWKDDAA